MIRRRFSWVSTPFLSVCAVFIAGSLGMPQVSPKAKLSKVDDAKPAKKVAPQDDLRDPAKRTALIDKMIANYDLTPHRAASIPENPPPHEGAMISLPYVVEPPDLVIVEVLEALPGRPISGERLVKSDGTISLGFYGDVPVKGLTLPQIKVAVIKRLRKFLEDDVLGLVVPTEVDEEVQAPERPPFPELPANEKPLDLDEAQKPIKKTSRAIKANPSWGSASARSDSRRSGLPRVPVRSAAVRRASQEPAAQPVPAPANAPAQINIPAGASGRITITIDVAGQARPGPAQAQAAPVPEAGLPGVAPEESLRVVRPEDSDMVFVDVTAYNSMQYYVLGDVATVGCMPWVGKETVLDALQYAGGLSSTADPKQISLVRPERGGKPARIYKVDLEAIQEKGQVATNYQIFPGDRLIIGRNEVVKKTVEIDRLNAPISTMNGMMLQHAFMLRAIQFATADKRDELLKEYVDFWSKALSIPGGVKFDEQTLRDAFIPKMKLTPAPMPTTPAPR